MIQVNYTKHFLKSSKKLPEKTKVKLAKLLETLQKNPFHSVLHTKPLTGRLAGFYSFRITRDWRVIFCFIKPDVVKLVTIGHRKDIYK